MVSIADLFLTQQDAPAGLIVRANEGRIFDGTTLTTIAPVRLSGFTTPSPNPRIDRVVIDRITGATERVEGTPAASPSPPAIPSGKAPNAEVRLESGQPSIKSADIPDEWGPGATGPQGQFTSVGDGLTEVTSTQIAVDLATDPGLEFLAGDLLAKVDDVTIERVSARLQVKVDGIDGTRIALASEASGDVMYYDGTDWVRLAIGSDGEVLTLASGIPSWASAGSGGGGFLGENGAVGDSGDIIRVNEQILNTDNTMAGTDNGSVTGPFSIASGTTLTISSGATFVVI